MNANIASKITCPHCGKQTSTESGFCDECGLELTTQALKPVTAAQIMASGELSKNTSNGLTCPFCGAALRPGARHCPNCGKKLPHDTAAKPAAVDQAPLPGSILR